MRVVEHHVQRRSPGGVGQCCSDAMQQSVAGTLSRHHLSSARSFGHDSVFAELRHQHRELAPRRLRKPTTPSIIPRERHLADRPHPRLKRDHSLRRAPRQHHQRALRVRVKRRSRGMTSLADPRLAQHQHRTTTLTRHGRLAQHPDLPVTTDQRLCGISRQDPRQRNPLGRVRTVPRRRRLTDLRRRPTARRQIGDRTATGGCHDRELRIT